MHLVSPDTGIQLGFLVPGHQSQPPFLHALMGREGYVISFEVADAAKAYSQVKTFNLPVVLELKEEQWGQLHFMVKDPSGIHIDVVEHIESVE